MYSVEILSDPSFPAGQSDPESISDAGVIAATSNQGNTANYVGVLFDGPLFKSAAPRASDSVFLSANNRGHAVGARATHADDFFAVFSDGTTLTDLPVPAVSGAVGINDFEEVIGWDVSDPRGFLIDRRSGALTRIPPPPGESASQPMAINAAGDIVGSTGQTGFVFRAGVSKSLGAFDPHDVNNLGVACGFSGTGPAICDTRAPAPAAVAQPVPAGFSQGYLMGINDSSVAVGQAWGASLANSVAFICIDGVSTDLNTLVETPGWNLMAAKGINNAGQIVGLGWINQNLMGFIASPVRRRRPFQIVELPDLVAALLGGITVDGGGVAIVGGKPRPVGPWGPLEAMSNEKRDALLALALDEAARKISDPETRATVRRALTQAAVKSAKAVERSSAKAGKTAATAEAPLARKQLLRAKIAERRGR
jgi:uncharacterized membrane protein